MEPFEEVDRAIRDLDQTASQLGEGRTDWEAVRDQIRTIGGQVRTARYPTLEGRNEARVRFESAVQLIRTKQEKFFEQQRAKKEHSGRHLGKLYELGSYAKPEGPFDTLIMFAVTGGLSFVAERTEALFFGERDKARESLQQRSRAMKEAWDYFSANKAEMIGAAKSEAFAMLKEIDAQLRHDWGKYKDWTDCA